MEWQSGRADDRGEQLPKACGAGGSLDRFPPTGLSHALMGGDGFIRAGDHRDPGMSVRMRVRPERVDSQADAVARPQDLEG